MRGPSGPKPKGPGGRGPPARVVHFLQIVRHTRAHTARALRARFRRRGQAFYGNFIRGPFAFLRRGQKRKWELLSEQGKWPWHRRRVRRVGSLEPCAGVFFFLAQLHVRASRCRGRCARRCKARARLRGDGGGSSLLTRGTFLQKPGLKAFCAIYRSRKRPFDASHPRCGPMLGYTEASIFANRILPRGLVCTGGTADAYAV